METRLLAWLAYYGPGALFLAQMFGIFGLPIPDELLLTVAGALVREGRLEGVPTVLAAIAGCFCGVTLSYVLGRTVGTVALHRLLPRPAWRDGNIGIAMTISRSAPRARCRTGHAGGRRSCRFRDPGSNDRRTADDAPQDGNA